MFPAEQRPSGNYPGGALPRPAALGAALFLTVAQLADPLLQLAGRLIGGGERGVANAASLHQRRPDGGHQLGSARAETQGAVGGNALILDGTFLSFSGTRRRRASRSLPMNTSQPFGQCLPAGAKAKPRAFAFFRRYTAASPLIKIDTDSKLRVIVLLLASRFIAPGRRLANVNTFAPTSLVKSLRARPSSHPPTVSRQTAGFPSLFHPFCAVFFPNWRQHFTPVH